MHVQAMKCLDKSQRLILSADSDDLIYAVLQARMAIEYLFYEIVPLYKDELPLTVLNEWQPQHIIREILDCNPDAQSDIKSVTFYDELSDGYLGEAFSLAGQTAVTKSLLKKHYHRLGKYLHAPKDLHPHDEAEVRSGLAAVIKDLERFRSDQIMMNIGEKITITCDYCGHSFQRRTSTFELTPEFQCRGIHGGSRCDAKFRAEKAGEGWSVGHVMQEIDCPTCRVRNYFPLHILVPGQTIICTSCRAQFVLTPRLYLVPEK